MNLEHLKDSASSNTLFAASVVQDVKNAVDRNISSIEAGRDLSRTLVVCDMDMFYAAGTNRPTK